MRCKILLAAFAASLVATGALAADRDLTASNNLSDVASAATARTNLGALASAAPVIAGAVTFSPDFTYDIGASGASRPRDYYGRKIIITGAISADYVITWHTTVSGLATCNAGEQGAHYMVTDGSVAASGNFGAIVAGGGANAVPVYCDGTNWRIG